MGIKELTKFGEWWDSPKGISERTNLARKAGLSTSVATRNAAQLALQDREALARTKINSQTEEN